MMLVFEYREASRSLVQNREHHKKKFSAEALKQCMY